MFRFEQLMGVARALWADGGGGRVPCSSTRRLALWREAPLADLADEPFAQFEIPRLDEARTGAIEDRIDATSPSAVTSELLPELEALVARHPYRERLRRHLMLALYRAGRQADALAAYQTRSRTASSTSSDSNRAATSARWRRRSSCRTPTLAARSCRPPTGPTRWRGCCARPTARSPTTRSSPASSTKVARRPAGPRTRFAERSIETYVTTPVRDA